MGFSDYDAYDRFLILRFQCPTLLKGNSINSEVQSLHKIIRVVRELIFQLIRKYDTLHISELFIDLDMLDMDTASFLYFLHENLTCLTVEKRTVPSLGQLAVNVIRSFKRDRLHILPLKVVGSDRYRFYNVSYESYMRQQAYPHIEFCSHPVHYFNYMYDVPFCLILDLHTLISFQRILKIERRRLATPEVSLDIGFNEVVVVDNIDGLQASYCFVSYDQFTCTINSTTPFIKLFDD